METDKLKKLWSLAFGDSEAFVELFFSTAYNPLRCQCLEEEGQITAALYWLDTEYAGQKLAYIYGVATHPGYRNRGLCRKLMEQLHQKLKQQGYAGALLMPAKPGLRQMYGKLGYRECTSISELECVAGKEGVTVSAVGIREYSALRRQYLPKGGVIQEGENLAYLATYAGLYAGDGFVMAAVHEDGKLFVLELLGDKAYAPGILKAMGYEKGIFRTPGGDVPFTMYCSLGEDMKIPTYFGLAFD